MHKEEDLATDREPAQWAVISATYCKGLGCQGSVELSRESKEISSKDPIYETHYRQTTVYIFNELNVQWTSTFMSNAKVWYKQRQWLKSGSCGHIEYRVMHVDTLSTDWYMRRQWVNSMVHAEKWVQPDTCGDEYSLVHVEMSTVWYMWRWVQFGTCGHEYSLILAETMSTVWHMWREYTLVLADMSTFTDNEHTVQYPSDLT